MKGKHKTCDITFFAKSNLLTLLLVCSFFLPLPALAGQTVVINKPVTHDVYGNGDLPNGDVTGGDVANLLDPNDNTVQIRTGGQVGGDVSGGYSYSNSGTAASVANNNTVTMSDGQVVGDVPAGIATANPAQPQPQAIPLPSAVVR